MSTKSKFQKKKDREKEVKKKVLARRTAMRAAAREENEKERERLALQRVTNRLEGKTIRNKKEGGDENVINQLEHNIKILEALQEQQELMEKARDNAPMLNTEGVPGVIDGTGGLSEALQQGEEVEGGKLSASADVVFIPNPVSNEEVKGDNDEQ